MFETVAGKKVLVTGSSSGVGEAIAKLFGAHGARVGVHYAHSDERAGEIVRAIGANARLFQADLLDPPARLALIPAFVREFGGIDVLINNAGGISEYAHFEELAEEAWDEAFELQVKAPLCLIRSAYPLMKKQKWGRIINISTVAVKYAGAKSLHYTASKAALETLTMGVSRDGAGHNVLANVIRAGLVDTPMRTKIAGYDDATYLKRLELVPLGRAGQPEDIARMALYLASEGGNFVTGECFTVAGGD